MMPVLNPAGVQEILDYGHSACHVALFRRAGSGLNACMTRSNRPPYRWLARPPERSPCRRFQDARGGLNIRPRDDRFEQERAAPSSTSASPRWPLPAPIASTAWSSPAARPEVGIITTGKSYLDLQQALDELGIDEVEAAGSACGCSRSPGVAARSAHRRRFAAGLDLIVIEEKRSLLETSCASSLQRPIPPVIVGKKDEAATRLFPLIGALDRTISRLRSASAFWNGSRMNGLADHVGIQGRQAGLSKLRSRQPFPISAPAVRTILPPSCPKAAAAMPGSAATRSSSSFGAPTEGTPIWVGRAPTG